jgi:hypothetical protein
LKWSEDEDNNYVLYDTLITALQFQEADNTNNYTRFSGNLEINNGENTNISLENDTGNITTIGYFECNNITTEFLCSNGNINGVNMTKQDDLNTGYIKMMKIVKYSFQIRITHLKQIDNEIMIIILFYVVI